MAEDTEPKSIDIFEMLAVCLEQLASVAWIKLGLQKDPMTQDSHCDLNQAKAAIDAVSALAPVLESELEGSDRDQIQTLVRNLKLNYVAKCKEASQ